MSVETTNAVVTLGSMRHIYSNVSCQGCLVDVPAQVVDMCSTMELDTTDNCCHTRAGMTKIVKRQGDNINYLSNDP